MVSAYHDIAKSPVKLTGLASLLDSPGFRGTFEAKNTGFALKAVISKIKQ